MFNRLKMNKKSLIEKPHRTGATNKNFVSQKTPKKMALSSLEPTLDDEEFTNFLYSISNIIDDGMTYHPQLSSKNVLKKAFQLLKMAKSRE